MRRRVIITLAAVLGLVGIALIAGYVWFVTGGLDRYFEARLKSDLAAMNIRTEVAKTKIGLRPGTVYLEDLRLYTGDDPQPFAEVGELRVNFEIKSLLARAVDVNSMELVRPILRVKFDEQGRSNLDAIRLPESRGETNRELGYLTATLAIRDGQVVYADAPHRVDGTVSNIRLSLAPNAGGDPDELFHHLSLAFSDSRLTYDERPVEGIGGDVQADVTREGARNVNVSLESSVGSTTLQGAITGWRELAYDFRVGSVVRVDRVAAVADPSSGVTGAASLHGRLSGKGTEYHFEGDLQGNDLLVSGARVSGLDADGRLDGDRLDYTWVGRLLVSRLTLAGVDASDVRFSGQVQGRGGDASVAGKTTVARVAGDGFTADGVSFDGRAGLGSRTATGEVGLNSIALRTVRTGSIRAKITADSDRVDVNSFTAAVYGGTVTGSATAFLKPGGRSTLAAEFRGLDVDQAVGAATPDAPHVSGRANGRIDLVWPGTNLQASTGTVRATVSGSVPDPEGKALPLDGELALTAVPGRFRIDRAVFRSGDSNVTATGTIAWNRSADLRVTADAANGQDLVALVGAANPRLAERIADSDIAVAGAFHFEGAVSGSLVNPNLSGHVDVGSVTANGGGESVDLGRFTAEIARDRAGLSVSNARLVRGADSEIAFDVTLPADDGGPQVVRAQIRNFPLDALAKASPVGLPPIVAGLGGDVSGRVDLRVPQGPGKAMGTTGTVDVSIAGAKAGGEPLREFRVAANLGEQRIDLSTLTLASARGTATGSGYYDKGSKEYRATFDLAGVDLKLFEKAPAADGKAPPVTLAGRVDGRLVVAGSAAGEAGLTPSELTADVTGTEVVVNGQPIGEPKLTVRTSGDTANVSLVATVFGERRELAGTIDVAKEDQPFAFHVPLADTDVTPFAALAGVRVPAGVTTKATGGIDVTGRLGDLASKNGIADNLAVSGNLSQFAMTASVDTEGRSYSIANRGDITFNLTRDALRFDKATFTGEGTELTLTGDLGLQPEASSNLTLAGDVNLGLLSSFTPNAFAAGVATIQANIAGTVADPRFSGFADLRDASLRVLDLPIAIQNGQGRILFNANQALIDSFTAQSNGGRVRIDGGALLSGLRASRWRFGIDAEAIRVNYPQDVRSVIDGQLTLQGNEQLQVLGGVVNVRRAEYTEDVDINDLLTIDEQRGRAQLGTGTGGVSTLRLDLRVEARDSIVVRNNLADVVASASLSLTGPVDDPIIDGRATVTRGTLEFRNGDYQVTRGVVRFPGRLGGDITFDVQAEADIRGYRVTVGLSGTPNKPYPVLRSEPPLPETQIASLVLTGELAADEINNQTLSQTGVGLASSLLSEAVSRSVEKRTSKLFGINRFQIDPLVGGADPSARLTLGRRVNKNLSIIYSTNITSTQEQVIQLEYRISDRFSVVASREENGAFALDFRVKKRF